MAATRTATRSKAKATSVALVVDADGAREVSVTGDFNRWAPEGVPLRPIAAGRWAVNLELPPGEYQYRLRVDGQWRDDPRAARRVPNPYGTENCVLTVG